MKLLVVFCAAVAAALAQPYYYVAPHVAYYDGIHVAYQNAYDAYARALGVYAAPYVYNNHYLYYAPYPIITAGHSDHPSATLSAGGSAGHVLNADGTPIDTPAVQAARAAHLKVSG